METGLENRILHEWRERYSNRGRWGSSDQLGTLNFITGERVLDACAFPRSGQVISCALAGEFEKALSDESLPEPAAETSPRSSSGTRWLAPAPIDLDDERYAGSALRAPGDAVVRLAPASSSGVVARGILLDLPRHRRLSELHDDAQIQPADLDSCAEAFGVTPESGDVVLLRTGTLGRCKREKSWKGYRSGPAPGLSVKCARWLYEREVAVLATDTWQVEVRPAASADYQEPLRTICLAETGLWFGESFDLDALSDKCAEDGRYAFLFSAAPLPDRLDGAAVTPLAIK